MPARLPPVRRLGRSTIPAAKPLPLMHWSGWSITPAYQRLALGPIWLTLVDPLDCTGIGVAGSNTRPVSTQPSLFGPLLCLPPGISTGRIVGLPFFLPQRSTTRRMTVIRTAKASYKPAPYPYQSTISQAYRRRNQSSLAMLPSSDAYPASVRAPPNAAPPPFEDLYFDSNGVLFRNGVAVVDQHGSIIRRPIVERPLSVFRPTLVDPETAVSLLLFHSGYPIYTDPACISDAALQSHRDWPCCAPYCPAGV